MLTFLNGILWAIWRRCFGEGKFKKIISRTVQEIIAFVILFATFYIDFNWKDCGITTLVALFLLIFYWIQAVGCILDAGLSPTQNRHNYDKWYKPLCNQIVDLLNWIFEKLHIDYRIHKYYGAYDWVFSATRNTIACIPGIIFFHSWWWLLLIFDMYPIYLACYKLYKKYPSLYENKILNKLYITEAKDMSEVIYGFFFGIGIGLVI